MEAKGKKSNMTDSSAEVLKGIRKGDLIVPKLPLIDPVTEKRQDGRSPTDIRPLYIQTSVRSGARGSSYLELGSTKVICVVNGPKDLSRKVDFSATGLLALEVQQVGAKVLEKDIVLLKEALEAVIILEKFPKCLLEISLTILEDSGSTVAACITAAGLALMDAGVPIYDLPVGATLLFENQQIFLDPTRHELETLDLTDSVKSAQSGGIITLGYLPTREQVCLFTMEGKMHPDFLSQCTETLTNMSNKILAVLRHHLVKKTSTGNSHGSDN